MPQTLDTFGTFVMIAGMGMIIMAIMRLRSGKIEWPAIQRSHLMLMRDGYMVAGIGVAMTTFSDVMQAKTIGMIIGVAVCGWLAHMYLKMQDTVDNHQRRYPMM